MRHIRNYLDIGAQFAHVNDMSKFDKADRDILPTHTDQSHAAFLTLVAHQPEITAAWTLTGEADYLLRVRCADLGALNQLVQTVLLPHPAVGRVQSQIVMDELKRDGPLPIGRT